MHIVYLDEFGHIGPFVHREDPKYNTSPVFGVAGFLLHEKHVRNFATWFLHMKTEIYAEDILSSGVHPATWEKKGNEIFTSGRAYKTKRIGYSLINHIKKSGGKIFFHGIEKTAHAEKSNPTGLYYTVLQHAIRHLEKYFLSQDERYLIVLDEHQSRIQLLEGAAKAMFGGEQPARHLIEPPYQVESHLYQTTQAADWIASIIGALWAYRVRPEQFRDREWAEKYFASRINTAATHSKVRQRGGQSLQGELPLIGKAPT